MEKKTDRSFPCILVVSDGVLGQNRENQFRADSDYVFNRWLSRQRIGTN